MTDKIHAADKGQPIVYVRQANPEVLPDHLKSSADKMFSVHDAEGQVLALTEDRKVAFALARQNDLVPVSVH